MPRSEGQNNFAPNLVISRPELQCESPDGYGMEHKACGV